MTKEEIKNLRERAGLSQEAFADIIGCCARTVSRWEMGASEPLGAHAVILRGMAGSGPKHREITLAPGQRVTLIGVK